MSTRLHRKLLHASVLGFLVACAAPASDRVGSTTPSEPVASSSAAATAQPSPARTTPTRVLTTAEADAMAKALAARQLDPGVSDVLNEARSNHPRRAESSWTIRGKVPSEATDDDVRNAILEAGCLPDQSFERGAELVVTVSCSVNPYEVVRVVRAPPLSDEQRRARSTEVAFVEGRGVRLEVRPGAGMSLEQARSLLTLILGADGLAPGSAIP